MEPKPWTIPSGLLDASGATRPNILPSWNNVDWISMGLVRSYRGRYVAVDGDRYRVERSARWSAVGNATVSGPDWYERARARTGE